MAESLPIRRYTSAGGVVVEPGGHRVLVLVRSTRRRPGGQPEIRLPKGHIQTDETLRQAALREVEEEAGLAGLDIISELGQQVVEFDWQGYHYVRDEFYFLMSLSPHSKQAQPEEQFEPRWLPWVEAIEQITFQAEREWLQRARSAWLSVQTQLLQDVADQDPEQSDNDAQVEE